MNILLSFHYTKSPETVKRLCEAGGSVLIDSGAYSRYTAYLRGDYTRQEAIDGMKAYADSYASFLSSLDGCVEGYFNLDMIGEPEVSEKYQALLEEKGYEPIPVWHGDYREFEGFDDFVSGYDYVAVPASSKATNISTTPFYDRKRLASFMKQVDGRAKVHFLGASNVDTIKKLNPYSSDSANHIDFWQARSEIKIFRSSDHTWFRLPKNKEDWTDLDAVNAMLDVVGSASLDELVEEANEQERFTISAEHIAKYAGWFNFSNYIDCKGFTKMHAALKEDRQIAVCAFVGYKAGWLEKSFFDWITNQ